MDRVAARRHGAGGARRSGGHLDRVDRSVNAFDPPVSGTAQQDPTSAPVLPTLPNTRAGGVAALPAHQVPLPPEPPFDARAMVASQHAKVAEPVYGALPGHDGTVNQAAIETARQRMQESRRKNDRFVRAVLIVLLLIV